MLLADNLRHFPSVFFLLNAIYFLIAIRATSPLFIIGLILIIISNFPQIPRQLFEIINIIILFAGFMVGYHAGLSQKKVLKIAYIYIPIAFYFILNKIGNPNVVGMNIAILYILIKNRHPLLTLSTIAIVLLTKSEGVILAISIALIVENFKKKHLIAIIPALMGVFWVGAVKFLNGSHLKPRIELWQYTLDKIRSELCFGYGLGHFLFKKFTLPHNLILQITYQWGIVGIFFLGIGAIYMRGKIKNYAPLTAFFIMAMVDNPLRYTAGLMMMIFIGSQLNEFYNTNN